jgi:hypothetical protein
LVYECGPEFWPLYAIVATMRVQLPEWTVFVGLTATLKPGCETNAVIQSVGFKDSFHFEKHDCKCHNIDLIICEIQYLCTVQPTLHFQRKNCGKIPKWPLPSEDEPNLPALLDTVLASLCTIPSKPTA